MKNAQKRIKNRKDQMGKKKKKKEQYCRKVTKKAPWSANAKSRKKCAIMRTKVQKVRN